MAQASDFTIEQLPNNNYVVKGLNMYQNIDFVNGGFITTSQRAIEIRDLLVIQANAPVVVPITDSQRISELEAQNAQMLLALVIGGLM